MDKRTEEKAGDILTGWIFKLQNIFPNSDTGMDLEQVNVEGSLKHHTHTCNDLELIFSP